MIYLRIVVLAVAILLALGTALASEYPFGSKVTATDSDVGKPCHTFNANLGMGFGSALRWPGDFPIAIGFWDTGSVPTLYDSGDVVYLSFGQPPLPIQPAVGVLGTKVGDIRLTHYGNYPAGSKVMITDSDISKPLIALSNGPGGGQIGWLNFIGTIAYDLEDPVIIHQINLPSSLPIAPGILTVVNDIRLTDSFGMPAGSRIQAGDPDWTKPIEVPAIATSAMPPGLPGFAKTLPIQQEIIFFDANGNSIYDYPDDVYLHFPWSNPAGAGPVPDYTVKVNDVRLNGPIA